MQSDSQRSDKLNRLPVNPRRHKVAPEQRKRVATAYVYLVTHHARLASRVVLFPPSPQVTACLTPAQQMQQLQPPPNQVLRRPAMLTVRLLVPGVRVPGPGRQGHHLA